MPGHRARSIVAFGSFVVMMLLTAPVREARGESATIVLDAATQVVPIGHDPAGLNNSIPLVGRGPTVITATGDARFGTKTGESYRSALVAYRDLLGHAQYASIPMNGAGVILNGGRYDYAMLTDLRGALVNNTGTTQITQLALDTTLLAGGTIYAGSLTSDQTGVAELDTGNSAFYNTRPIGVPQNFHVSVSGEAFFGPGPEDKYGSIVVQFRDPTNGINYDALPIGASRDYFGYNFRIFLTEIASEVGNERGTLEFSMTDAPEPGSVASLLVIAGAILRRGTRHAA